MPGRSVPTAVMTSSRTGRRYQGGPMPRRRCGLSRAGLADRRRRRARAPVESPGMSGPASADRLLAPEIVGRDAVLERLRELLAATLRRGAVVQLVADPGLGQTRIAAE